MKSLTHVARLRLDRVTLVKLLMAMCLALFATNCQDTIHEESTGQIQAKLVSTAPNGIKYALRNVSVAIAGPQNVTLTSNDLDPNEATLSASLSPGIYTATLASGWRMERLDTTPPTVVTATLLTPNPATLTVTSAATTDVTLTFQTAGGVIVFAPGTVNVKFTVQETAATIPQLSSAPITDVAHDMVVVGAGAWVVSSTQLTLYAPTTNKLVVLNHGMNPPVRLVPDGGNGVVAFSISANRSQVERKHFREDGSIAESGPLFAATALPTSSQFCVARGSNGNYVVVTNDSGLELHARILTSSGGMLTDSLIPSVPAPASCAARILDDGTTLVASINATAASVLSISSNGTQGSFTVVGTGAVAPIHLANDETTSGYYVAYGTSSGVTVQHRSATAALWSTTASESTGTVSGLVGGTFFANAFSGVLVGGTINNSGTGAKISALSGANGSTYAYGDGTGAAVLKLAGSANLTAAIVSIDGTASNTELRFYNR